MRPVSVHAAAERRELARSLSGTVSPRCRQGYRSMLSLFRPPLQRRYPNGSTADCPEVRPGSRR